MAFLRKRPCNDIILPEPDRKGGKPLMEALQERRSIRTFADRPSS